MILPKYHRKYTEESRSSLLFMPCVPIKSAIPYFCDDARNVCFGSFYRSDLVPVFGFGQNNLFPLIGGDYNSRFSRFQRWLYSKLRSGICCCWGFTWCLPERSPVVVVGKKAFLFYCIFFARIQLGNKSHSSSFTLVFSSGIIPVLFTVSLQNRRLTFSGLVLCAQLTKCL